MILIRQGKQKSPGAITHYEKLTQQTGINGRSPLWDFVFPFDVRFHIVYDAMHGILYGLLPDVAEGFFLKSIVNSEAQANIQLVKELDQEFQSTSASGVDRITRSLKFYKDFTGELITHLDGMHENVD